MEWNADDFKNTLSIRAKMMEEQGNYKIKSDCIAVSENLDSKKIQKSWIKMSVENLSQAELEPGTMYTWDTFDKSKLYISFYPAWDDY